MEYSANKMASFLLKWRRIACAAASFGAVSFVAGPSAGAVLTQGPSGSYLLKKAEALAAAGQYDAAAAAFNQAKAAFRQANDLDGQQRALTALAALDEKQADLLLAAAASPPPARANQAAPARAAALPAAGASALPASAGPTPVAGKVVSGQPLGLFLMTHSYFAFGRLNLDKATWYFAPDGRVFHNPGGLDAAGYAALPPGDRGRYQAGASPVVKWADGRSQPFKIEPTSATTFNFDGSIFVGMGPFQSTSQLVGAFEGGNAVGGASAASGLVLRADGTYSGSSSGTVSATSSQSTVTGGGTGSSAGRWSLSGWVLTLTDAAGRTIRGVAYPIEKDGKTGQVTRFYFDNVAYRRQ